MMRFRIKSFCTKQDIFPLSHINLSSIKITLIIRLLENIRQAVLLFRLRLRAGPFNPNKGSNLIVSLTSFPARIDSAWIAIETIFAQDMAPEKVILVLSEEEFPTRELPKRIESQVARGLEVLWIPNNLRSYNKLVPVRRAYPSANIVTFDDDIIYEPWRLRKLVEASLVNPHSIVGHRGSVVQDVLDGFKPYLTWPEASPETPPGKCFLTGVGGILYPPNTLPEELLDNTDLAFELCPSADDIWFWAIARIADVPCFCLGNNTLIGVSRLNETPALRHLNCEGGRNDTQLAAVTSYFNLTLAID